MTINTILKEKNENRLKKLEKGVEELKALVKIALKSQFKGPNIVKIGGLLKGVQITEEDIQEAKKSLFSYEK